MLKLKDILVLKNFSISISICLILVFVSLPSLSYCQEAQQPRQHTFGEEQDYRVATGLFRDSLFQLAESELEAYLEKYPESLHRAEVMFLRAECFFFMERYNEALKYYDELLLNYPQSTFAPKGYFRKGETYLRLKKYNAAVDAFKLILDRYPDSEYVGEAAYWIAESYSGAQDYQNALKYYTFSYEQGTKNRIRDYAIFAIAWTYQSLERYKDAIAWYDTLQSVCPTSPLNEKACFNKAECFAQMKDYSSALTTLQNCRVAGKGDTASFDFMIAEYLFALERFPEAEMQYELFLQSYPDHPRFSEAKYGLGWSLFKQKRYRQAANVFKEVGSGTNDFSGAANFQYGKTLKQLGQRDSALIVFEDLAEHEIKNEWREKALLEAGLIYFEDNNIVQAKECFQKILSGDQTSSVANDALRWLGECSLVENKFEDAGKSFARVVADTTATDELRAVSLFQLARCAYLERQYGAAMSHFEKFLQLYPNHTLALDALFWLGESEYQSGKYQFAIKHYQQILDRGKNQYVENAYYGIGWSYYKLNRTSDAIETFEKLLVAYPKGKFALDARLRIADAYYAQKEYKNAATNYRLAIRMFPDSVGIDYAYYQLGQSYYRLQDYSEAYKAFEGLIATMPNSPYADDAQYSMGYINLQQREFTDAIKDFQSLIRKYPLSDIIPKAYYSIGDCFYNSKNYSAARRSYEEIIQRFPRNPLVPDAITAMYYCFVAERNESAIFPVIDSYLSKYSDYEPAEKVWLKKCEFLVLHKQYSKAAEQYSAFTEKYPRSQFLLDAYFNLAKVYLEMGNQTKAREVFENVISLPSASENEKCKARLQAAELLTNERLFEQAISYLNPCLSSSNAEIAAEACGRMGMIYSYQGKHSEAINYFDRAIEKYPKASFTDAVRILRAQEYCNNKNYSAAEKLLQEVIASKRDTLGAEAYCLLGDVYFAKGEYENAIRTYLRVKYLFPSLDLFIGKAYIGLGKSYEALGDKTQARKMYNEVLQLRIDEAIVNEARTRLQGLQ